jgi:hypothetical protein
MSKTSVKVFFNDRCYILCKECKSKIVGVLNSMSLVDKKNLRSKERKVGKSGVIGKVMRSKRCEACGLYSKLCLSVLDQVAPQCKKKKSKAVFKGGESDSLSTTDGGAAASDTTEVYDLEEFYADWQTQPCTTQEIAQFEFDWKRAVECDKEKLSLLPK